MATPQITWVENPEYPGAGYYDLMFDDQRLIALTVSSEYIFLTATTAYTRKEIRVEVGPSTADVRTDLRLGFSADYSVPEPTPVFEQQPVLDAEGQPVLDADGKPVTNKVLVGHEPHPDVKVRTELLEMLVKQIGENLNELQAYYSKLNAALVIEKSKI